MKKILIVLVFTLLLTGCNAEYNIHLGRDIIKEEIYLIESIDKVNELQNQYGDEYFINKIMDIESGYEFYKRQLVKKDEQHYAYKYNEIFPYYEYDTATLSSKCYEEFILKKDKKIITLKTSEEFICYDQFDNLDKISITLTTDYKVIKNNADLVKNGKYIWVVNKNNKDSRPIYLELKNDDINNKVLNYSLLIGGIGIVITLIVYLRKKRKIV